MRHAILVRVAAFVMAVMCISLSVPAYSQALPKADADKPLRFDVVSIRLDCPMFCASEELV